MDAADYFKEVGITIGLAQHYFCVFIKHDYSVNVSFGRTYAKIEVFLAGRKICWTVTSLYTSSNSRRAFTCFFKLLKCIVAELMPHNFS